MNGKDYKMIYTDNPYFKSADKFLKPSGNYVKPSYKANKNNYNIMVIKIETNVELCGDVFFKLINSKNKELICRFAVNTSFVE